MNQFPLGDAAGLLHDERWVALLILETCLVLSKEIKQCSGVSGVQVPPTIPRSLSRTICDNIAVIYVASKAG